MENIVPQDDLPASNAGPVSNAQPAPTGAVPADDLPASVQASNVVPEDDLPEAPGEKYGSTGQQALAGVEGVAKGVVGPLATLAETKLLGVDPADIAGREEANPWTHGVGEAAGLLGGSFIPGVGEYTLGAKAAEAANLVSNSAKLGRVGSAAIKGAIESGIFQGSDEISKAMLGQGDPEAPVSAALAHMGAATLLGGGIGGVFGTAAQKLSKIASSKAGADAAKFLQDFGAEYDHRVNNTDTTQAVTDELNNLYSTTMSDHAGVYGETGLKSGTIAKVIPEMNDAIMTQNGKTAELLQNKFSEMAQDPDNYPPRLVKKFQEAVLDYIGKAHDPAATPSSIFDATEEMKQWLQAYSKFDKQVGPLSPEKEFIGVVKDLSHTLRTGLEDTGVWGQAGKVQADLNGAFTNFRAAKQDLLKKFMTKVDGVAQIDPGKVATYVKQVGKPNGEIKQSIMKNFMNASEEYRNKIASIKDEFGDLSPEEAEHSYETYPALQRTLNEPSAGAKAANYFFDQGTNSLSRKMAEHIVGGSVGAAAGGPLGAAVGTVAGPLVEPLVKLVGKPIVGKLRNHVVPAILKALSTENAGNVRYITTYATGVSKGAQKIADGVENLFQKGSQQLFNSSSEEKDREKLKKFIENGELDKQMQSQLLQGQPQSVAPKKFAEGGMVQATFDAKPAPLAQPILQDTGALSKTFPDQSMLLASAKGRINNYLNGMRPLPPVGKLAFDDDFQDPEKDRAYTRALDIANNPLSVLDHIKKGTLEPEHVKHFNALYPELASHLNKKITDRITKAQTDDEKPTYKVRQGLSMLMGTPLSGEMTPANIQAAQAVFAQQAAQRQAAPMKPKKGTGTLSKASQQYQTSTQAAEARQSQKA